MARLPVARGQENAFKTSYGSSLTHLHTMAYLEAAPAGAPAPAPDLAPAAGPESFSADISADLSDLPAAATGVRPTRPLPAAAGKEAPAGMQVRRIWNDVKLKPVRDCAVCALIRPWVWSSNQA